MSPMERVHPDDAIAGRLAAGTLTTDPERGLVFTLVRGARGGAQATPPRPLLGRPNRDGYLQATIRHRGQRAEVLLHRVVWIAAHGRIPPGLVLDHIDRVRTHNWLSNLRAVTQLQNTANSAQRGETCNLSKLTDAQVAEIRLLAASGAHPRRLALTFGVSRTHIYRLVGRKSRRSH